MLSLMMEREDMELDDLQKKLRKKVETYQKETTLITAEPTQSNRDRYYMLKGAMHTILDVLKDLEGVQIPNERRKQERRHPQKPNDDLAKMLYKIADKLRES